MRRTKKKNRSKPIDPSWYSALEEESNKSTQSEDGKKGKEEAGGEGRRNGHGR